MPQIWKQPLVGKRRYSQRILKSYTQRECLLLQKVESSIKLLTLALAQKIHNTKT